MKKIYTILSFAIIFAGSFSSCVPNNKHLAVKEKAEKCEEELSALKSKFQTIETEHTELTVKVEDLGKRITRLNADTNTLGTSYRLMSSKNNDLNKLNNELFRKLEMLRSGSEAENRRLLAELEITRLELQRKEDALKILERELDAKKASLEASELELAKREARVKELEAIIKAKEAKEKALLEKVRAALLAFEGKGLTVEQRNGRIYVSMEAKLLFSSGSTKVGTEGKSALVKLAKVLQDQTDIEILVEGHTDTDKINSSSHPKDNWELSVLRATEVVKIMMGNSTINPKQLTAAGRGEYLPVDPSDKSKNRRIEIILIPNLDALFEVLESK